MNQVAVTAVTQYQNKHNEHFEYTIYRNPLTLEHNYFLYTIQVKHPEWGFRGFSIFVTKAICQSNEQSAEHLAVTLGLDEVKLRMDQATATGFPMLFPSLHEGWTVL
jgi:hypothetical protein